MSPDSKHEGARKLARSFKHQDYETLVVSSRFREADEIVESCPLTNLHMTYEQNAVSGPKYGQAQPRPQVGLVKVENAKLSVVRTVDVELN